MTTTELLRLRDRDGGHRLIVKGGAQDGVVRVSVAAGADLEVLIEVADRHRWHGPIPCRERLGYFAQSVEAHHGPQPESCVLVGALGQYAEQRRAAPQVNADRKSQ